jgi:hypothetical protein
LSNINDLVDQKLVARIIRTQIENSMIRRILHCCLRDVYFLHHLNPITNLSISVFQRRVGNQIWIGTISKQSLRRSYVVGFNCNFKRSLEIFVEIVNEDVGLQESLSINNKLPPKSPSQIRFP